MKHIVVDLEMNIIIQKSEARRRCKLETIEIGAVMLDEYLREISSFRTYVKPEYNDHIVKKITRLTGITDEMIQDAPSFNEALRMFTNWCLGPGDDVSIYAWSENDYSQIESEMQLKDYVLSESECNILTKTWLDFQKEFDTHLGFERQLSLKTALDLAGLDFNGREHDALDDAKNTAKLLHIMRDKALFDITLKKIKEVMEPSNISNTMGELFDFSQFICA